MAHPDQKALVAGTEVYDSGHKEAAVGSCTVEAEEVLTVAIQVDPMEDVAIVSFLTPNCGFWLRRRLVWL